MPATRSGCGREDGGRITHASVPAAAVAPMVPGDEGCMLAARRRLQKPNGPSPRSAVAAPVPVQEGETPGGTRASRWEGYAAYHLAVNIMVAYLAGLALLPGTDFDTVFRFTTSAAFLGYCSTSIHGWLSERRSWRMVWRPACRGLVCSLVVGSIFAG